MTESLWNGRKRIDFDFDGREAILVIPDKPRDDNAFVFRAEFFDAFPYADIKLLEMGFYIAYVNNSNRFGSPVAVDVMYNFHNYLTDVYELNEKCVLFGFSRGGLYASNYAAKHPEKVSVLYLDAPVLNILSWPYGFGSGVGSAPDVEFFEKETGVNCHTVLSYRDNPVDKIDILLKNNIPIITVCGLKDDVVPFSENMEIFEKKYREGGGNIKLITKPDCGHHPHSLENPEEIINFILGVI